MNRTKQLALAGLLLAVLILFERFIAIDTQLLRVSFAYVPYILAGWLLGPVWAAIIGVTGDLLGMLLMPKGSFFAGFTLNALLTGAIYGLFLHNKPVDKMFVIRLLAALLIVHAGIHLGLTTLWLSIMYHKAFIAIIIGRILANIIELPIEFASMFFIISFLEKPVHLHLREQPDNSANAEQDDAPASES
ncbi:MAG: folate family ECF transporter S component [Spirochaetaceae bacterium]|jgi:ECF transporter S component (folate family)|nr:folate family ECF transporter S component [Spirochaetaceae bacterium]